MGSFGDLTPRNYISDPVDDTKKAKVATVNGDDCLYVRESRDPADGSYTPSSMVISKKTRVDWNNTKIIVNGSLDPYTTLHTYSGSGKYFGFSAQFDNDNIMLKLVIDSDTIFDVDMKVFKDMFKAGDGNDFGFFKFNNNKMLTFKPLYPIPYSTSVTLSARHVDTATKKNLRYAIYLSKES